MFNTGAVDYADYHQAMQHVSGHQLHPGIAQIPMLSGLNLTMVSGQLNNQQHQLGQLGQHQVMYAQHVQVPQQQHQQIQQAHVQQQSHHHQVQQQQQVQVQVQQQSHQQHQQNNHGHGSGHEGGGGGGSGTGTGSGRGRGRPAGRPSHNQNAHLHGDDVPHHIKKRKHNKVNKDGIPAPKRATTAYINFTQWYREEMKKSGRTVPKIGDFGKECAAKWNSMTEDEKKPFVDSAERDRERYKVEMAVYKPPKDVNKPKRPGTAFMLFMQDFRKEIHGKEPEGGVAALAKLGGERWRNMADDLKRPYQERQNEEKIAYEARMEEYRRKV